MIKNYIKIAMRSLLKHKVFSSINILGLAIGMASCLLIVLFIVDELSFDKHHTHKRRIYRVEGEYERGAGQMVPSASANFGLAPLLKAAFPQIEKYVRITFWQGAVKYRSHIYAEDHICYADSTFFDLFSFDFVKGNALTAIDEPNTVVLTERIAKKYFGNEDPMGKFIELDGPLAKVTGVIKEAPSTSHFHPDFITSVRTHISKYSPWMFTPNTCGTTHYTYLLLPDNFNYLDIQSGLKGFIKKYIGENHDRIMSLNLQPLEKIHLYSHSGDQVEAGGNITYIWIFGLIAAVILLIACINYINLTTARALERSKEIGMRKVTGASKSQLVTQFLMESVVISFLAFILAYLIALCCIPMFNALSGKELSMNLAVNGSVLFSLIGFSLLTGLAAGLYPAFFMSGFKILRVFKGDNYRQGPGSLSLRKGLVILQFCISISLIISTILIYSQIRFLRNKELGINTEQLISVPLTEAASVQYAAFKTDLLHGNGVIAVTSANNELVSGSTNWRQYQWKHNARNDVSIATMDVDQDFFSTLKIKFKDGRGFSADHPSDSTDAYVVNEKAAEFLNLPAAVNEPLLGSIFNGRYWSNKKGRIIGVVKDFHFASLHQEIKPVVFNLQSSRTGGPAFLWLRISGGNIQGSIDHLKETWKKFEPEYPLVYSFMDEDVDNLYKADENFLEIFMTFSALAIFIACLGIFGLAYYTSARRFKEIGIRKTLGASVSSIVMLLSKDLTRLVIISFIIAVPLAWYGISKWLLNYAYRIDMGPSAFVIAGIISVVIAWLTVSFQAVKAAVVNPVISLRTE